MIRGNRELLRGGIVTVLALTTACSDGGPTGVASRVPTPVPAMSVSASSSGSIHTISDDATRATLDASTGHLSVQDLSTGTVIHAMLEPDMVARMIEMIEAATIGDANYTALENLDPYAYLYNPPDEPDDPPTDFDSTHMAEYSTSTPIVVNLTTLDVVATSSLSPILRRVEATPVTKGGKQKTTRLATEPTFSTMWSEPCGPLANDIGGMRLAYHQARGTSMQSMRLLQAVPMTSIKWENGQPFIRLENLKNWFITAQVDFAESQMKGLQLNIMRFMYNGYNCEAPIVIQVPTGQVLVPTTTTTGGGGQTMVCTDYIEMWEISYDGGRTWWPFPIERSMCVRME